MSTQRRRLLGLIVCGAALLLAPARAGAAPAPAGAATPEAAVAALVQPFYDPAANSNACNAVSGRFADCPISARLRARLESATENGNIVSRSQNPPRTVSISLLINTGSTAEVATRWNYRAGSYVLNFVVVKEADGWVVDDSTCAGTAATSIYNAPTGPCPFDTGGGTAPGMPVTGGEHSPLWGWGLALSGLLLLGGLGLTWTRNGGRRLQ